MTPYKWTEKDGVIRFHYRFKDLRNFLFHHLDSGAAGHLLWGRGKYKSNMDWYRCSGTIDNPMEDHSSARSLVNMHMTHNEIFDGKQRTPDQICTPPKEEDFPFKNAKMIFLDLSDYEHGRQTL